MNYWQLIIKTDKQSVDFIEEVLMGLGASSIDFSDSFDNPILEPSVDTTPLWQDITLKVLFIENIDKNQIDINLKDICNIIGKWQFIADKNWQKECNKNFGVQKFGTNLWICPSWEDCKNIDGVVVEMDPGMAFGTGSHQTTSLCLEYLASNPPIAKSVLDFGTGSGILAIAAKKLGATEVFATDNDPQAIIATINNIDKNSVIIDTFLAGEKTTQTDIVIANILTNTLLKLYDELKASVKDGGKIILSGILQEQEKMIIECYQEAFTDFTTQIQDDWILITATKI